MAAVLGGDLTGDGAVDADDEPWLLASYGSSLVDSSSSFEPAADLDGDGDVDVRDLARFGAAFGLSGGDVDLAPAGLFVTVNDIPDDMNDLLVVPPGGFQITLDFDGTGGSAIDPASLSVTSSEDALGGPAGSELADHFSTTPTGAVWDLPQDSELARTSHFLTVSVRDAAGNESLASYGFAVRDFVYGAPLGNPQTVFLDFDEDRSLGLEIDFVEDLRSYGLSSTVNPWFEATVKFVIEELILERVRAYYTRNGADGPLDPVNIAFTATQPLTGTYSRLCVGGRSSSGATVLGAAVQDDHNIDEASDDCNLAAAYGVFPQAIRSLWGTNADFKAVFGKFDKSLGGIPLGEDFIDAYIVSLAGEGGLEDLYAVEGRPADVANAVGAFAQIVATAIAHETGHLLGLTARGAAPAGLFGGVSGSNADHNVTISGSVPTANYIMNRGSSFTFGKMSARGWPLPVFRELNWAYLHDRVALNDQVTSLDLGPALYSIAPNPAVYTGPYTPLLLTIHGDRFEGQPTLPIVQLIVEGDPTPNPVLGIQVIDSQTIKGQISQFLVPPALYDVKIINPDGQEILVPDFLDVRIP